MLTALDIPSGRALQVQKVSSGVSAAGGDGSVGLSEAEGCHHALGHVAADAGTSRSTPHSSLNSISFNVCDAVQVSAPVYLVFAPLCPLYFCHQLSVGGGNGEHGAAWWERAYVR